MSSMFHNSFEHSTEDTDGDNHSHADDPLPGPLARLGSANVGMGTRQQIDLLQLSLIEQRCLSKAAKASSLPEDHPVVRDRARDLYTQVTHTLQKAGVLSKEAAGLNSDVLRSKALELFDSALDNHLINQAQDISNGFRSLPGASTPTLEIPRSISQTLLPEDHPLHFYSLILEDGRSSEFSASIYARYYQQICLLGKGGFGAVYKARHQLDGQEYAIKKITFTSEHLRLIKNKDQFEALLSELRYLAQLSHQNIVRYHTGWVEIVPAALREPAIENGTSHGWFSRSELEPESEANDSIEIGTSKIRDLRLDNERDILNENFQAFSNGSRGYSDIFETREDPSALNDYFNQSESKASQSFGSSQALVKHKLTRLPSNSSADEEVLRSEDSGFDVILYIKMGLHPMTLEDYLWPDQQKIQQEDVRLYHCFHILPTASILISILDGLEYIHSKRIVHRDLKPSNVFLSQRPADPTVSLGGSIDTGNCKECRDVTRNASFITPHIGDFGLVAKLSDDNSVAVTKDNSESSALALISSAGGQAGTRFYRPPSSSKICPKLDVYSLGVIAFELLNKFGTKTERAVVLSDLLNGIFPAKFEKHEMADGIKHMLWNNRDDRWGCTDVRKWLKGIIAKHEK